MSDLIIQTKGHAGCITLNRPDALNALTYQMVRGIEAQLDRWTADDQVKLVIFDAAGDRAFCAGGDIAELYKAGRDGRFDYGQKFWRDEYRMNAKLFEFPKPVVSFLHGFTMGGGVGVGCHGSHRIVCETSQIAMPEVGIGLIPDVGGSTILANAPGRCGEYLGATAAHMDASDAIYAGFADYFVPQSHWDHLKNDLVETGDWTAVDQAAVATSTSDLEKRQPDIDGYFADAGFGDIVRSLQNNTSKFADGTLEKMLKNSSLSMDCAVELIHRLRGIHDIRKALEQEYRFTHRALEHSDILEGIRAAIIDKTRDPKWQHAIDTPLSLAVSKMLMPLGAERLSFEQETPV